MKQAIKHRSAQQRLQRPGKLKERLYPGVLDLFSQNDFSQLQILEICQRSKFSPSTIHKYLTSKEGLLFSILDENIHGIVSHAKTPLQGLESTKEIFLRGTGCWKSRT